MSIRAYTIGRTPDNDVVVNHDTVSRLHAELVMLDDGRAYLTDCGSTSGTSVYRQNQWQQIQQDFVNQGETLSFGDMELSVSSLIAQLPRSRSSAPQASVSNSNAYAGAVDKDTNPQGVRVRRDPRTGEILPD